LHWWNWPIPGITKKHEHIYVLKNMIFCIKDATVKLAYAMRKKKIIPYSIRKNKTKYGCTVLLYRSKQVTVGNSQPNSVKMFTE